jgi:hypothetical protein
MSTVSRRSIIDQMIYLFKLLIRANGIIFLAKLVANEIRRKIKVNNVISFQFKHMSPTGIPIQPVILKIRHDISWQDVLNNRSKFLPKHCMYAWKTHVNFFLTNRFLLARTLSALKRASVGRKFFDEFAKSNNFSPLDAAKWYSIKMKNLIQAVSLWLCFDIFIYG